MEIKANANLITKEVSVTINAVEAIAALESEYLKRLFPDHYSDPTAWDAGIDADGVWVLITENGVERKPAREIEVTVMRAFEEIGRVLE